LDKKSVEYVDKIKAVAVLCRATFSRKAEDI
jgi:hypothetical protein